MSSNSRPPLQRKQTRASDAKVDAELDQGFAFVEEDGTRLAVRVRDVKGVHDAQLRAETGFDFMGLLEALAQSQGLDRLAAAVWFARLVNGRPCEFSTVLNEVGYADFMRMDEPQESDALPEA